MTTQYIGISFVAIYPTIDRLTRALYFKQAITTSFPADQAVIVACGLVTLYFLLENKKTVPFLVFFGALEIYLFSYLQSGLEVFSLLMVPAIIVIIAANKFLKKKIIKHHSWKNLLYTSTAVVFCFEVFIMAVWIIYPFAPGALRESVVFRPVILEFELFYAFARAAPIFLIFVSYSFLTKIIQNMVRDFTKKRFESQNTQINTYEINKKISDLSAKLARVTSSVKNLSWTERLRQSFYVEKMQSLILFERQKLVDPKFSPNVFFSPKVMLGVAIVISVVFAVYPYLPTINPHYTWVSVDDFNYQQFLGQMHLQQSISDKVRSAFTISGGDRPLTMILLYLYQSALGSDAMTAVRFFSVLIGPALVVAAYFFVKEGTKSRHTAAYAALFTAFSHQLVVGIYAGFFANWLGMAAAYMAFLMVHKFWQKPSLRNYLLVFGHSVLSFLMYIYVDVYFLFTLLIFLIISALKYRNVSSERKKILILSTIFAVYATVFAIRILLGTSGLFESVFAREDIAFSYEEFRERWRNFPFFLHYYVGGFLANTAILVFAFVWTLYAKYENTFDRILLSSLFVGALPLVFGNEVLQSRVFFDMPVHIVAAITILRMVNRKDVNSLFAKTVFSLVTIHFAIYALRSLSSLVLPP